MRLSIKCAFLYSLMLAFSPNVWAQQERLVGSGPGKSLGEAGDIWPLLSQARYPLRVGILPLHSLDEQDTSEMASLQSRFNQLLTNVPTLRYLEDTTLAQDILSNQDVLALSAQQPLDLIVQAKIKSVAERYWLMLSFYSGPSGKVIFNTSTTLTDLNPEAMISFILSQLAETPLQVEIHDRDSLPLSGELHLRTRPEGMQVYLNQQAVGLSPLFIRQLPPGEHLIQVQENQAYQINRIQIVSSPPGISVEVNGKTRGQTPLDLPVELLHPGTYHLRFLSQTNYTAEIRVQTQPEHVPIQLNQLPLQRSPVSFQELTSSEHTLTLLPYPAVQIRKPFVIMPEQATSLEINAYKSARIIIDTSVGGAQIHLNGEPLSESPYTTNLPQGQHHITLSKTRYRTQEHLIELQPGETRSVFYELIPRSTDTSIFLTPTGELSAQLNLGLKYLSFGSLEAGSWSHLYGLEIDYGWPEIYRLADIVDIGLSVSAFAFSLNSEYIWRRFQGLGTKIQFLRESDSIPISAAIGTYLSLDPEHNAWVGYLSLSRHFGDFAIHLGLQTHGFNLNFGYTGWDHIRLGALVYSDSFFRLLAKEHESSTTFYGLQLGYSF